MNNYAIHIATLLLCVIFSANIFAQTDTTFKRTDTIKVVRTLKGIGINPTDISFTIDQYGNVHYRTISVLKKKIFDTVFVKDAAKTARIMELADSIIKLNKQAPILEIPCGAYGHPQVSYFIGDSSTLLYCSINTVAISDIEKRLKAPNISRQQIMMLNLRKEKILRINRLATELNSLLQ